MTNSYDQIHSESEYEDCITSKLISQRKNKVLFYAELESLPPPPNGSNHKCKNYEYGSDWGHQAIPLISNCIGLDSSQPPSPSSFIAQKDPHTHSAASLRTFSWNQIESTDWFARYLSSADLPTLIGLAAREFVDKSLGSKCQSRDDREDLGEMHLRSDWIERKSEEWKKRYSETVWLKDSSICAICRRFTELDSEFPELYICYSSDLDLSNVIFLRQ